MLLAIGIVLVAANLRPAAAGIGPLIDRIKSDTGLSDGGADILVALPVFCFGALAPLAPTLARRFGARATVAGALALLLLGLLVRLLPGLGFLFVGTAIAGTAIAVANVLLPVLVRSNFPERVGLLTGLYSTTLIGFAALAAGVSVPVADAFGGGWRPGLAIWAIPAAFALARVGAAARAPPAPSAARPAISCRARGRCSTTRSRGRSRCSSRSSRRASTRRSPGCRASSTPRGEQRQGRAAAQHRADRGPDPGAHGADDGGPRARPAAFVWAFVAFIAAGWIGVIVAPMGAPYLWVVLLGFGQNAAFPLALTLIVLRGGTVTSTAGLSTLVQTVGYMIAAVAPFAIGAVHDITGSWTPALFVLLGLLIPQLIVGLAAARNRTVCRRCRRVPALDRAWGRVSRRSGA